MLSPFLQDRAVLYASGGMPPEERERFEGLLEFEQELRDCVVGLLEAGSSLMLSQSRGKERPSDRVKKALLRAVEDTSLKKVAALVYCGPDGLVKWVSSAFTEMCGYPLEELRGKRLGPILQGAETDPAAAARLRAAVKERRACRETLVNYHKDGHSYGVDIDMAPFFDDEGEVLFLMARETEVP